MVRPAAWALAVVCALLPPAAAQGEPPPGFGGEPWGPPPFGRWGPGEGPGPMGGADLRLVGQFDQDRDGRLNREERQAARAWLDREGPARRPRLPGAPPWEELPSAPGPRVTPADAKSFPDAGLYEPSVLRTLFFTFEDEDWEAELEAFYHTDVEVPALLTVDGEEFPGVGVGFRGASSFFTVPAGSKRSLNVSLDHLHPRQRLRGHKTLNLLNSHEDPSFLRTILFSHIARRHLPAPRANLVKVVINGESWGVYVNVEQFNKDFVAGNFGSPKGARWKVKGSPWARGGLEYLGEDPQPYRDRYGIKSADDPEDWQALLALCRTLNQTPLDELEEALRPILDLEGVLWFLALDNALINNDGYWIRASDYNLYKDPRGVFHIIPHDMNETFGPVRPGPGPGRGPGGGRGPVRPALPRPPRPPDPGGPLQAGVELDPLIGLDDPRKPLRSRLLAVPGLRQQYLERVRRIAEESLDWEVLGPLVAQYRRLIEKEIEADTRRLHSLAAFQAATADSLEETTAGRRRAMSLRAFVELRRRYLLERTRSVAAPEPEPPGPKGQNGPMHRRNS